MTLRDIAQATHQQLLRLAGRPTLSASLRRYPRYPCFVPAKLTLVERGYMLEGAITEVSRGGLRFREATTYILDRRVCRISIALLGIAAEGTIVNVSSLGYGISLSALLDDDYVETLMDLTPASAE
jgi:hypothetical protein